MTSYAFCQYSDIGSVVKAMRSMDGEHLGANRIKLGFGKSMPTSCVWVDGIGGNCPSNFHLILKNSSRSKKSSFSNRFMHSFRLYVGKVPEHAVPSIRTDISGRGGPRARACSGLLRADYLRASRREGNERGSSSWATTSGRLRITRMPRNVLRTSRAAGCRW